MQESTHCSTFCADSPCTFVHVNLLWYLVTFTACLSPKKLRGWVKSALIKLLPEEFLALLDHLGQGAYLEATKKIKQQKVNF